MKRRFSGILSACLFLFTACGQTEYEPVSAADPASSVSTPSASAEQSSVSAREAFGQVTCISEEWQPGQYLINGLDQTGTPICGILDSTGYVHILEDYASVYALADGKMIASDFAVNTRVDAENEVRPIQGNIVDTSGNILYKSDDSQRLYILDPETVFVVRAATGFEGDVVEYGVLNQNGEWRHEWTQTDVIPVEIEDGQISFEAVVVHIMRGKAPESPALFAIGGEYLQYYDKSLYYWTQTQNALWTDISQVLPQGLQNWQYAMQPRPYGDALLLEHNVVYQSDGTCYPIYNELVIGDSSLEITPEIQSAIDENRYGSLLQIDYLGNIQQNGTETPVFQANHVFCAGSGLTDISTRTMYLLGEDDGEILFGAEYASTIEELWANGENLVATLKNTEGDLYAASFAADGTTLAEPYPLNAMQVDGVDGNRLLLHDDSYDVAIRDAISGEELFHVLLDEAGGVCTGVSLLSNEWILIRTKGYDEEDQSTYTYALYQMDGTRIA